MSVLDRAYFVGLYGYERQLSGYYKSYPENYTDSHYFFIPSPVRYSSTMEVRVCCWRRKREFFIKSFIFDLDNMRIKT